MGSTPGTMWICVVVCLPRLSSLLCSLGGLVGAGSCRAPLHLLRKARVQPLPAPGAVPAFFLPSCSGCAIFLRAVVPNGFSVLSLCSFPSSCSSMFFYSFCPLILSPCFSDLVCVSPFSYCPLPTSRYSSSQPLSFTPQDPSSPTLRDPLPPTPEHRCNSLITWTSRRCGRSGAVWKEPLSPLRCKGAMWVTLFCSCHLDTPKGALALKCLRSAARGHLGRREKQLWLLSSPAPPAWSKMPRGLGYPTFPFPQDNPDCFVVSSPGTATYS